VCEKEVRKLIGKKKAKAISDILVDDHKGKQREQQQLKGAKILGVPFWSTSNDEGGKAEVLGSGCSLGDGGTLFCALRNSVSGVACFHHSDL
jgi:hypothetical protein